MFYSRRDLGKIALATLPAAKLFGAPAKVHSKVANVQLGAITYSFRTIPDLDEVIKMMVQIGLGEAELMSDHAERSMGAPLAAPRPAGAGLPGTGGGPPPGGPGGKRPEMTPEQREAMQKAQAARAEEMLKWRTSVSMDKYKDVRKKFDTAGIQLALYCFNMNERTTDDEIEYAFNAAKALGVRGITTSTQLTVAKRIAPFADKHKMIIAFHGHDNTSNPNEFSTPETFATAMTYSKYCWINLDIGHFTATNADPVPYIKEHHDRITNLHVKDRKKDHGPNTPWGQGDTPIKEVLKLMSKEKYSFPANIELEYRIPDDSDVSKEMSKCLQYCKDALA